MIEKKRKKELYMRDRKRTCVTIEKCLLCKTELFGYEIHANRAITFSIRRRCTD